jgi:hypothetical protein
MTIKIEVECDASDCRATQEIDDNHDSDISREGWHTHPYDGYQHYCPSCWPAVKEELDEESAVEGFSCPEQS